jgi:hypothetical protein
MPTKIQGLDLVTWILDLLRSLVPVEAVTSTAP